MAGDICLILGNEITGVDPEILALVDSTVEIPMLGQKQSLNVATAGGICMYELVRSRP
jgi:tRNA G18 (ribose-2'-O)-methylase SpoU